MKLYEIDEQIDRLLEMQWDNGLSDEDIQDTLNSLLMDKYDKCVNVSLAIKNLKKSIEVFEAEEKRLNARRKSMEKKVEWLKGYLASSLQGEQIDDPRVRVYYGTSNELVIDTENIPEEYVIHQEPKIDKARMKADVKNGREIDGVHIEEKKYIVVK